MFSTYSAMNLLLFGESDRIVAKLVRKNRTSHYKRIFLQLQGTVGYKDVVPCRPLEVTDFFSLLYINTSGFINQSCYCFTYVK